jgi:CHU_C Type IX secretion signal domain/CUB domain
MFLKKHFYIFTCFAILISSINAIALPFNKSALLSNDSKAFGSAYILTNTPQIATEAMGILYDSGGPNGNYEDNTFNQQFDIRLTATGCISLTIDSLGTESNYDSLTIYDGHTGELLDKISGTISQAFSFQVPTDWLQVRFNSDAATNSRGFKLSWQSFTACNAPKATTCAMADIITSLPFSKTTTTCADKISGVNGSTCLNNAYLEGKDHIFKFTSAGTQCLKISLSHFQIGSTIGTWGKPTGINVGVYKGCPSSTSGICVATGRVNSFLDSVILNNAHLDTPGDYYIVVSRRESCTPFSINIEATTCINRLPNAGYCDKALSLNDCSNSVTADIVLDLSSQGDSSFIETQQPSNNAGCISSLGFIPGIDTPRYNYVFLYFKAQTSGKFAFTVSSILDDPNSDVDFNFYGPINSVADVCNYTKKNAPLRSSFGIEKNTFNRSTGMLDIYTSIRGLPIFVLDTCEIAEGDGIVKSVNVQKDKYYALWLNDYRGTIGTSGVRLNFSGTSQGVLDNFSDPLSNFTAGKDTILFPGKMTQISAKGGITYTWTPTTGLSNASSATTDATPLVSTKYKVNIQGTCNLVPRSVNVEVFDIQKFKNQTVCDGEELYFEAGENYAPSTGATWAWTSPTGHLSELSCTNCNAPVFNAKNTTSSTENHTFTVTLNTPGGVLSETFTITVSPGKVAKYQVQPFKFSRDTNVCKQITMNLLKPGFDPTAAYSWSSIPSSILPAQNPSVNVTQTTKYYLTVTGGAGGCMASSVDSVIINVYQPPVLSVIKDTTLCTNVFLPIGNTVIEAGTTYKWSPATALNNANIANPLLTVPLNANTYTLTATNLGTCSSTATVKVTGVDASMRIDAPDSINHCKGTPLTLKSVTNPLNIPVRWSSDRDFSVKDSAVSVVAMPMRVTKYYAQLNQPGCFRRDTLVVLVDSLPFDTRILPKDTTVCKGTEVVFYSPSFEPYLFPNMSFKWTPKANQLTSDTLYNLVFQADTTRFWYRVATNGVCTRKDSMKIIVNPIPTLTVVPQQTTFCSADVKPVTFNATSDLPAQTKEWKWKDPNGQEIPEGKDKQSITVTPQASGTYTVMAKIGDCPGSGTANVTINASPSVTFTNNDVLCSGLSQSTVLNTTPNPTYTYQWTSTPVGFTSAAAAPSVSPTVSTIYSVNLTSSNGCTRTMTKEIRVATGTLTTSPDVSACSGNNVNLTATGTSNIGGTYRWSNGATTTSISPTVSSNSSYTVTFSYGNNCTAIKTIQVTALPGFTARINPDTFSATRLIDQGNQITLNATLVGNAPSPTFAWTDNDKPSVTTQSASFKPSEPTHTYKVLATSSTGCTSSSQVTVTVRFPGYEIPNAFTPNGDNINANFNIEFDPDNISKTFNAGNAHPRFWKGNIVVQSFQVFSRWGSLVYDEKSQSILNDKTYKGWDGKKGGTDMPSDVYVYLIKLLLPDGMAKSLSGELNLIR